MKARAFALALLLLPMGPVLAAEGMAMDKDAAAALHHATGVVKSVDAAKGTVSIAHGPVATLRWPAMTMAFAAEDTKLLQNLKPGAKVEFEFTQQGSRYVITSIK
jgi:Cu(I)/Ag(I) efflux system protein CusF